MTKPIEPTHEADFVFAQDRPFRLDAGGELQPVTLRYARYGAMNAARDNVILVCHALSGSARAADWWSEMFGPERPFDPERHCILCVNVLGSCYGSTGPTSLNPHVGQPYAGDFPVVSIGDVVRSQAVLLDHLGVEQLYAVVGGSIGGLQALAWATTYPERVQRCVAVGAAPLGAMGLALSHLQRQAIRSDPAWRGGHYATGEQPAAGLALARGIAMCTYKSAELFDERYGRRPNHRAGEDPARSHHERFDVAGYLDYQGQIFVKRFDANAYLVVSKMMDTFELGSTPVEEHEVLRRIRASVLLLGITSDWLFPAADVRALAERMRAAGVDVRYAEQVSSHGHDGFLAEGGMLAALLADALREREGMTVPVA
jgi:homoserine O-acetyltransferase/O-succinyltransferase